MKAEIKSIFDSNFGKYITLSDEAYHFLETNFVEMEYPQRSYLVEGGSVAKYFYFALSGVQAGYLINDKGEKVIDVQWHNIVGWGKIAENMHVYLKKGKEVAIQGKLRHRTYDDKEGIKRYTSEVWVNEFMLLS